MWVEVEDAGDAVADGVVVVGEFGLFGVDHAVEVYDVVTGFVESGGGGAEHVGGVAAAVGGVGVREQAADIGQGGGAEDCVGDGVEEHVGIAVSDELARVGHVDATEAQGAAGGGSVRVFAEADSQVTRGKFSGSARLVKVRGLYPGVKCGTTRGRECGIQRAKPRAAERADLALGWLSWTVNEMCTHEW